MLADGVVPGNGTFVGKGVHTLPLTPSQTEILATTELGDSASCAFNESDTIILSGTLDADRFVRCAVQAIEEVPLLLAAIDKNSLSFRLDGEQSALIPVMTEADLPEGIDGFLAAEASRPFDLNAGPLVRAMLIKRTDNEHIFVMYAHHIAYDGFSASLLLERMASLYNGAEMPVPASFSALAVAEITPDDQHQHFWKPCMGMEGRRLCNAMGCRM